MSERAVSAAAPERASVPERPPAAAREPAFALHATAGNSAVADLLTPAAEAEADAVAASLHGAPPAGELLPLAPPQGSVPLATRPLPRVERDYFEPRLGYDLSAVRIATGADAAQAAEAEGARAFASGPAIAFGRGERERGGRQLLGHELAHVLQQARAGRAAVQRQQQRSYEIPRYEYRGGRQQITKDQTRGRVDLDYDGSRLRCTFFLDWRWHTPAAGARSASRDLSDAKQRERYKADFVQAVKDTWERQAPTFVELEHGRRTGRTATLQLELLDDSGGVPVGGRGPAQESDKTNIDVVWSTRAHVQSGDITLDAASLDVAKIDTRRMRDPEQNPDYANLDVPIRDETRGRQLTQVVAVHEFGHIVGLADEYVLPPEDVQRLRREHEPDEMEELLTERSRITGRLMNVGMEIPNEYFAVFARWLSDLTGKRWTTGAAPAAGSTESAPRRKKEPVR